MKLLGLQASVLPLARPRPLASRAQASRRRLHVCAQATSQAEEVDENIGEYCSLDKRGQRPTKELTLKEKEELFIEAMLAFYYDKKPVLSNEEFDNLKEELTWEGSKVVVLSSDEKRFLEARVAHYSGHPPIMSDAEYDALKARLAGSSVFAQEEAPTCSLGNAPGKRGQRTGEAALDYARMSALYVAPGAATLAVLFLLDAIPGIDIDMAASTAVSLPIGIAVASFLFKDALCLKASCPNCGEENKTYFGDIFTVAGSREKNTVKCPCCESQLSFDAQKRQIIVLE